MRNRNGIEIRECCASCFFKELDSQKGRICLKSGGRIKQKSRRSRCESWEISEGLIHAGDSGGLVKRIDYLNYYRERYLQLLSDLIARQITEMMPTEEIRREYEANYGSIYINI